MAEWSKALRSGRSPLLWAWVRIPLLTNFFAIFYFTEYIFNELNILLLSVNNNLNAIHLINIFFFDNYSICVNIDLQECF